MCRHGHLGSKRNPATCAGITGHAEVVQEIAGGLYGAVRHSEIRVPRGYPLTGWGAMGAFFSATSMIGFIAGAGIVVRNSIILVDFIELRVAEGMPLASSSGAQNSDSTTGRCCRRRRR